MRLVWSQLAAGQVDEVLACIVADDAAAAGRWLEELLERVEALRRFRVIYRRSEASVEIAVVRHQARHFDEDGLAR